MKSNIVVDRKREWFQPKKQRFEFNGNYDDWYVVRSWCLDRTKKLKDINSLNETLISEFVKYSEENFPNYSKNRLIWEVERDISYVWNSLPYDGYNSPYIVSITDCYRLKDVLNENWVQKLLNEPDKIINHSTIQSLELMLKEVSEWKMNMLWEGNEPQFH